MNTEKVFSISLILNPLVILILVVIALIVWIIKTNNGLIYLKNKVDEALSNIDAACMKRTNSVQQCYNAAANLATHEQKLILENCQYRTGMNSKEISELDANLTKAVAVIKAVAENNPQIAVTDAFVNLQNVVSETEDTLFAQRRIYNSNVTVYNSKIKMIPTNIVAGMQHATPYEFLKATEAEKKGFEIPTSL